MAKSQTGSVTAPKSYEGLKDAISDCYSSLSRQLQQIARYALENPNDLALETVSTLAARAEVQPSSMVRFAQTMGYNGFTDMQQVFRSRLMEGAGSYRDRIRDIRKARSTNGDLVESVLDDFVDEGIASLQLLRDQIGLDAISEAVDILAKADEIYLLAQGRAFPVTFYLGYALGRLDKRYRLLDSVGGLLNQQAAQATRKDAFIAVSFKPYTQAVADIVTAKNENGIPIVAITDSPLSPLAMEANISLEVQESEQRAFRSLVSPMCLAQTLVVALGHKLAAANEINGNGKPPK